MTGKRFAARVALVTGASRGIGRATALRLAADGAAVIVNYRSRPAEADEVVQRIRASGGTAIAMEADVADREAVDRLVENATEEIGPISILVNNAGIFHTGKTMEYDEALFDGLWQVNVKGVLHASLAVAPKMMERRYGRIVNLSSIAALGTAMGGTTLYAMTKGAILTLTKRLALELGPSGITVNAVLPGFVLTEMVTGGKSPQEIHQITEAIAKKSALRRTGEARDIANVISFLASDQASFITGQFITADGGRLDLMSHA